MDVGDVAWGSDHGESGKSGSSALFVAEPGPGAVVLGVGAFGKVWLGRAKLTPPPLPASSSVRNSIRRSTIGAGGLFASAEPGEPVAIKEIAVAQLFGGIEGLPGARKEAALLARCQVYLTSPPPVVAEALAGFAVSCTACCCS
jgi:hypothetical protein